MLQGKQRAVLMVSTGHDARRLNFIPLPGAILNALGIKLAEVSRWTRPPLPKRQSARLVKLEHQARVEASMA
jgi:hypothetical protein